MLMSMPNLSANTKGRNQYQSHPICMSAYLTLICLAHFWTAVVDDLPDLWEILQGYINDHVLQKDIPDAIQKDHGVTVK